LWSGFLRVTSCPSWLPGFMPRSLVPILNTILFTILVPGTVAGYIPYRLTDGFAHRTSGPMEWLGLAVLAVGAAIYFRCAWEFAARGLGMLAAAHIFVVLYEEPTLRRQFGESYEEYRRTVPRWIPKLPSGKKPDG
jgi:protein-S-isoprenylcysteine O-methyltransferase Ste14